MAATNAYCFFLYAGMAEFFFFVIKFSQHCYFLLIKFIRDIRLVITLQQ